ncbi:MAG: NADH-quinone oxidoreductase subunit L [Dissulfurispiraceae bacterium]
MQELLWLIPTLPFAGFLTLALIGARLSRLSVILIGVGSVALSAFVSVLVGVSFIAAPPHGYAYRETLWTWLQVSNFRPEIAFYLDALSLVMVLVVTFVGFLIHLYSTEFMSGEEGYSRFFAYMNLFMGSMLTLVLADNLLLLYLGWEGVGLCSYLLIGFWYKEPANGRAAMKAFIVTRIGDTAMAIGLIVLFNNLGTMQIQELMLRASQQWPVGSPLAMLAAALLLGGAVGKSAQLPLQTWLPDAMAGPTPVSALIHAATMVTAGVYLIARTHLLFSLAPLVQSAVAVIGAATLLLAAFSALTQRDIKRVLAYSTISQIGYMFLALGVGAWSAAIFHFMVHAFFKALLFLGAGAVILSLHHEHDMFNMGGLRSRLPLTFWTFLIGSASLSALPLVTAGYYSKDLILWQAWASRTGGPLLWAAGLAGAFLTSLYTFRMVFLTFFGEAKTMDAQGHGNRMSVPLVILAFLSIVGGFVELPLSPGNQLTFTEFIGTALPAAVIVPVKAVTQHALQSIASVTSLAGVCLAYIFFRRNAASAGLPERSPIRYAIYCFLSSGWGFDRLYDKLIVQPYVCLARLNKADITDLIYQGIALLSKIIHQGLSSTQNGRLRWYALTIGLGAAAVLGLVVLS